MLLDIHSHQAELLRKILEMSDALALSRLATVSSALNAIILPMLHTLLQMTYPEELVALGPNLHLPGYSSTSKICLASPCPPEDANLPKHVAATSAFHSNRWKQRLQKVLKKSAGINALVKNDRHPSTALSAAIRTGHPQLVRFVLRHGADPNQVDMKGYRPLHCCCDTVDFFGTSYDAAALMHNLPEIALLLLQAGADLRLRSVGPPPRGEGMWGGEIGVVGGPGPRSHYSRLPIDEAKSVADYSDVLSGFETSGYTRRFREPSQEKLQRFATIKAIAMQLVALFEAPASQYRMAPRAARCPVSRYMKTAATAAVSDGAGSSSTSE